MHNNLIHLLAPGPSFVSEILRVELDFATDRIRKLFELGAIYLNKNRIFADQEIQAQDYLRIHSMPRRYPRPAQLEQRILWEDARYLLIDKPAGVPCHPTLDNGVENLLSWLRELRGPEVFITHRLDVGTSGLLIYAKDPRAAAAFNKLLLNSRVEKVYRARVQGHVEHRGLVEHFMEPGEWAPRRVHAEAFEGGRPCRLQILSAQSWHEGSELEIRLETGRTHQIRVQMAALGHPIINDEMYGAQRVSEGDRWELRSQRLGYRDPWTGEQRQFEAPPDHD